METTVTMQVTNAAGLAANTWGVAETFSGSYTTFWSWEGGDAVAKVSPYGDIHTIVRIGRTVHTSRDYRGVLQHLRALGVQGRVA